MSRSRVTNKPPSYVRLVQVSVNRHDEDAWNNWYDTVHIPAILACPGYISVRRYRAEETNREADKTKYVTVYEIESPKATQTPELNQVRGWGPFDESVSGTEAITYREVAKFSNLEP